MRLALKIMPLLLLLAAVVACEAPTAGAGTSNVIEINGDRHPVAGNALVYYQDGSRWIDLIFNENNTEYYVEFMFDGQGDPSQPANEVPVGTWTAVNDSGFFRILRDFPAGQHAIVPGDFATLSLTVSFVHGESVEIDGKFNFNGVDCSFHYSGEYTYYGI
ncbi:MAG: hypothetical protein EHM28_02295 [Spirochaetaceae bacterium]|nr:MAG: hypothetical protein EHM28_02295 [Spirochaetaceae bacterium]